MSEYVPTGVEGLDELVSGGLPRGRVILVLGGPGAGKTILASQFLYKGIFQYGENGIFVSLDEGKNHFYSEMLKFGWDFKKAEEEGKFLFIDATRLTRVAMLKEKMMKEETSSLRGKELQIDRLVEELQEKIQQIGAKRVVLDSITGLMSFCSHSLTFFSKFLQVIVAKTRATESNALFLASPEAHDQVFISYLREIFDGTLEMKMETEKGESGEEIRRLLRLFSLKGAKHKTHWALFEITNKGIVLKSEKEIRCVMCSRQIEWEPHLEIIDGKQYNFDSVECATTYKRLKALYGESFE